MIIVLKYCILQFPENISVLEGFLWPLARNDRMFDLEALNSNRHLQAYLYAVVIIPCRADGERAMHAVSSPRAGEW